jgi:hypothetical protein
VRRREGARRESLRELVREKFSNGRGVRLMNDFVINIGKLVQKCFCDEYVSVDFIKVLKQRKNTIAVREQSHQFSVTPRSTDSYRI